MEPEITFGKFVRERRMSLGLTQAELAGRVGCATITVRRIESDDLRPSTQVAERLAMCLDVPLEERANFVRLARSSSLKTPEPIPTPTPPPSSDEIGQEDLSGRAVHGYELGERIGAGGFGVVYRAVQPSVEREVAIKIILPQYANQPEFIRRFESEARLVARLEHPHIVPLYDYWREPNAAYLIMRLLRGGSLRELLKNGPLAPGVFLHMLEQVSAALHTAHRFGVIHRDLKPANILLDEEQNAYLADFGIAKNLGDPNLEEQTQVGVMIGSPAYISPEQIRAEPVRPQADIYCLGVLIFEMLSGRLPFQGPTPIDYITQHLSQPLPSLRPYNPDLPAEIDGVLQRATAKEVSARYPDALSLLADVRLALGGMVELAAEPTLLSGELADIENPYKGLRAFSEADAEDFFGRQGLVRDLLGRLGENGQAEIERHPNANSDLGRFLALVGPSGSGKSSVIKAGLIPALRRGGLPGSENWFITQMTPGPHPLEELEAALLRVAVNPPESLLGQLVESERGLLRTVRRILPDDGITELVLVIDQFEELFTLVQEESVRLHFLQSLTAAVLEPRSRLHVVITMRADFTDRPLEYIDFGELMRQRTEFILPLTPDELEQAISGPARRVGLLPESGLVSHIVREVGDQPGALPLLQYALTELFEQRQGRKLTLDAYKQSGGVSGALARRAEQIYSALNDAEREAARQVFLRLVTLGESSEDTRRRVLRSELEALALPQTDGRSARSLLETVLEQFGRYRLLTFGCDPITRGPTVEVAHEALLREWPRLRTWLESGRADLRTQRSLALAAAEWQNGGQDASFLLRGARLEQFEAWSGASQLALTLDEQAYLSASLAQRKTEQAAEEERRQREARLRRTRQQLGQALIVVLAVALLIASGLSIYAWRQRQLALEREQTAQNERQAAQRQAAILLAAQSETELQNGYFDRAVLLALETLENFPYVAQAEHALGRAVSYNRALQECRWHQYPAGGAAWSPDGRRIASISSWGYTSSSGQGNQIIIWEANTCQKIRIISLPVGITGNQMDGGLAVLWTPDGERLIALTGDRYLFGSQDFDLSVWNVENGEMLSIIDIPNQAAPEYKDSVITKFPSGNGLDFAPGSGRLATLGGDNTALIWDTAYQKPEVILKGHENDVNTVAWSPDGKRLATTSLDGTARIWNAASGETQLTIPQPHEGQVNQALWSPDGTQLATAGEDGKICLWDTSNGEQVRCIESNAGAIWSLAWSPDGERLASGHEDGSIRIWERASGKSLIVLRGHSDSVIHLAWAPNDQRLASTDDNGGLRLWNVAPSTARLSIPYKDLNGNMDFTSDGRYLAIPIGDNMFWSGVTPHLAIWDVLTGKEVTEQLIPDFPDYHWVWVRYSPDDTKLLMNGTNKPFPDTEPMRTSYIFDARSGKLLQSLPFDGEGFIFAADWSNDGSLISTTTLGREIWIWDVQSGQPVVKLLHGPPEFIEATAAYWAHWSPDGTRMVSSADVGGIWVWDTQSWKMLLTYTGHPLSSYVTDALWSPDGKRVMSASTFSGQDMTVRIWDGTTGEELLVFNKHTRLPTIGGLDWSPDGSRAISSDESGTTIIFDTTTGDKLLSLDNPEAKQTGVAIARWSPNGKEVVIGAAGAPIQVWHVWQSTEELLAYAKECCVFRQLTPAERQQFGLPAVEATGVEGPQTPTTPAPEATPGAALPALPVASLGLLALVWIWRRR